MKTKPIRAPEEFVGWIDTLSDEFSRQTGLPKNNTATMRRLATFWDGRMFVKGIGFDAAIFGRGKKNR